MLVSGQSYVYAALIPGERPRYPSQERLEWATGPVWTGTGKRETIILVITYGLNMQKLSLNHKIIVP